MLSAVVATVACSAARRRTKTKRDGFATIAGDDGGGSAVCPGYRNTRKNMKRNICFRGSCPARKGTRNMPGSIGGGYRESDDKTRVDYEQLLACCRAALTPEKSWRAFLTSSTVPTGWRRRPGQNANGGRLSKVRGGSHSFHWGSPATRD